MDKRAERIANEFAGYLKTGEYDLIAALLADDCILKCSTHHIIVRGRTEIQELLQKAKISDHSGRFPVKLTACVGETQFDSRGNQVEFPIPVVYVHEDVFSPYHKTYIFYTIDNSEKIDNVCIAESARIRLIK